MICINIFYFHYNISKGTINMDNITTVCELSIRERFHIKQKLKQ